MKSKIDLSIIIVSFNTKKLLDDCLNSIFQSLKDTQIRYEVIVVDNNSTDGSLDLIERKYAKVKLVKNKQNLGFGAANNQGVAVAAGETILLLNSDIRVINRSIELLYEKFMREKEEMIVGGKLFNFTGTPQPSCGPAYTLPNIILALFFKGDYLNLTRYSPNKDQQVDWIMGACMMLRKATFTTLGGFDTGIFMYMEEIDLLYRAKKQGIKVKYFHEPRFYHAGAGSSGGQTHPIVNVFRGLLYFYKKHHSQVQFQLLRIILLLKVLIGIILFSIVNKKSRRKIYMEAIKIIFASPAGTYR